MRGPHWVAGSSSALENGKPPLPVSKPTVVEYRKVARHAPKIDEYPAPARLIFGARRAGRVCGREGLDCVGKAVVASPLCGRAFLNREGRQ